jgi:hypothetical protein
MTTNLTPPASFAPSPLAPAAPRDFQRESLDRIVTLLNECTAEEQRIDREYAEALAREKIAFEKAASANDARTRHRKKELAAAAAQREEAIVTKAATRRQVADTEHAAALHGIARTREGTETALKKAYEATSWEAESEFVTFQMKVDADEVQFKKEYEASLAELASLGTLETAANTALAHHKISPFPYEATVDEALLKRIEADPKGVLAEYRTQAEGLLRQIQALTKPSPLDDVVPFLLLLLFTGGGVAAGWFGALGGGDPATRMWVTGGAGGGALIVGIGLWVLFRVKRRARITARSKALYVPMMEALTVARRAATLDPEAAAAERARRVSEARRKRDGLQGAAREKAKAAQVETVEVQRAAASAENAQYQGKLAEIEAKKTFRLNELQQFRETTSRQIEEEDAAARREADDRHAATLADIENTFMTEVAALKTRWEDGLRHVSQLLAAAGEDDPRLLDWNSPAWEAWTSPKAFDGRVRFGEMTVNLAGLTEHMPQRLELPAAFAVPAMLEMPARASLLAEFDHAGRKATMDLARLLMTRLLTRVPAGRVKFTLFDPVGLGQTFAGFMHLADHDESLVGSRIWTEKEHIQQRLADLTEHMETVIQKYLRNEYATIDEYNAQAGELAEPFRYLVIADFPAGFEQESLRRLASIAMTGPRCGVYTIILRDSRQPLPQGTRMEDLLGHSVHLSCKGGEFAWQDAVLKRFPLAVDATPGDKTLTGLMDKVGVAAKDAKRVEVPFESIAPANGAAWSMTSKDELRVPIGKCGATRLQALRLGVGVAQHTLVAGKTGSGKSNLMHTIVTNLALWYPPDEVEFYLVDFKKGVEFKAYVSSALPHARAIAVESDREFGLSVLQRVDAELSRRGVLFRDIGVQDIASYREKTGQKLPRTILLIDEFQEFFAEDDKLSQEAAGLLDRLVRQGRAFGVHLVLGSQTIGGSSGLARSTLGQVGVRVALQCSEADSQLILGDNNGAARLLTRPGEAIYNDAGGLLEANSPFQIAFLPDDEREEYLERIRQLSLKKHTTPPSPIVFEGNTAAALRDNRPLATLLERPDFPPATSAVPAYIGAPVAIKEPTAVTFRRQTGANVLMVGQQEESAVAIFASMISSLAAQHKPGEARFVLMDGSPADSRFYGLLERVLASTPHEATIVPWRGVPETVNELATIMAERQADDTKAGPAVYLLLVGLQRFRLLRKQEEDFSFSRSDEPAGPKTDKQFAELLSEGPALGLHMVIWADTPITVERTLDRGALRQFDYRILFQMSASDSSNLIDSPLANRLGAHRGLLYSEEQGTFEKFRPYEVPDADWIAYLAERLKTRG